MALEQTSLGTGIRFEDIQALNIYWSQVRLLYTCFEANVRASDSSVFDHEMPGGQYTNLMVCSKFCLTFSCSFSFASSKLLNWALGPNGLVGLLRVFFYSQLTEGDSVIKQKYIEANDLVSLPMSVRRLGLILLTSAETS